MGITDKTPGGGRLNRGSPRNSSAAPSPNTYDGSRASGIGLLFRDETYAIIIGCAAGLIVLALVVVCLVVARKRRRKGRELEWDNTEKYVTKSAPISRSASPKMTKRMSCPDTSMPFQKVMVRSMTTEGIPDFTLPPERVQPTDIQGRSYSLSSSPYQNATLGNLQPDLYESCGLDDDSVFSLPPSEHGRIWFSVIYDAAVEELQVTLVKVRELVGRGRDNAPRDPFVKIFLLPDERNCRVSKVRKRTLSPIYNEMFTFQVSPDEMKEKVLRFSVYDVDKRRVRHSLGHALISLKDFDLTKGDMLWRDLENNSKLSRTGEISFSLNYLPNIDRVKVIILSARNLRQINYDKDTGVYIRIQMMHGRKVYRTKKTIIQRANSNPTFNESFSFNISGKVLDSCSFEIAVMKSSKNRLGTDEVYGRIVIGSFMFARGPELLHWQEMLSNARTAVTRWHDLSGSEASS